MNHAVPMSFSKINTFNHCQKKFMLKYVYNYPEINNSNEKTKTGSIIHSLIYFSFMNKKILSESEILSLLKNCELSAEELHNIKKIYEQFANIFVKFKNRDFLAEHNFEFLYNNFLFNGDIDLILFNQDETVNLIDFKTNKNIEPSLHEYYKQMFIYKNAMEMQGYKVKELILINLKIDEIKEITLTNTNLEDAKKGLDNELQNIINPENSGNSPIKSSQSCQNCGFSYLCNDL